MNDSEERRILGRAPSFSYVKLVTTDANGEEKVLPMMFARLSAFPARATMCVTDGIAWGAVIKDSISAI